MGPQVRSRQLVGEERQQCNSYNAIAPRVVQARGWYHSFHQFTCLCDMVVNGHRMVWSQASLAPVGSGAQAHEAEVTEAWPGALTRLTTHSRESANRYCAYQQ